MTTIAPEMTLSVNEQIEIKASPQQAFEALLARLGPQNVSPGGQSMHMKLEPWPGGRWFRDLGDNHGHLWGHVQVIKPPELLEITGPLFMSYPAVSHVQFRFTESGQGATLSLQHQALGLIDPAHREGVQQGWNHLLEGVKDHAENR